MSAHQTETACLRQILLYGDIEEHCKLETGIAKIQREQRSVKRLAAVTALFTLLALAGVAYGVLLHQNFPHDGSELVFRLLCELGLASLICLVGWAGLLIFYRLKLNRLREECLQLVVSLLESHSGKPQSPTLPSRQRVLDDGQVFQDATKVSGDAGVRT